jgi:D-inositol-3-phosphate glycosyltransferase
MTTPERDTDPRPIVALYGCKPGQPLCSEGQPVVGMQVVLREFAAAAAARRSGEFRYGLARLAARAQDPVCAVDEPTGLSMVDVQSVLADPRSIAVWHDLGFDPIRSFAVRRRVGGTYPIAFTQHSLSYKYLVHDNYLPLLLQRPQPSDAIVCTSAAAREALSKIINYVADSFAAAYGINLGYRGRLEVIPLGVDTSRFRPLDPTACRAKCGIANDAFVMLWTGRLSAIDKADLLPVLRVLVGLKEANPNRRLLLVCAGSEYADEAYSRILQSSASDWNVADSLCVRTAPTIGPELYGCADLFLSPIDSIQESFGLTPVEAMACGIPQVVSDWNGYRDTVVDGVTGYRIPTLWASCASDLIEDWYLHDDASEHALLGQTVAIDLQALQFRIQQLIDSPSLRQAMAAASRVRAVAEFDWQAILAKHEALYREFQTTPHVAQAAPVFDLRRLHYTDIFGHYATHMLDGSEDLVLTTMGMNAAESRTPLRAELRGVLEPSVLSQIISLLLQSSSAGRTLASGELIGNLSQNTHHTPPLLLRHLLWLIKHGWITASTTRTSVER